MHRIFLSLGSNLGDRRKNLHQASDLLQEQAGSIFAASSIYETEPWGFVHENYFYNQVICIRSHQNAAALLESIHGIEKKLGRKEEKIVYAARIIDIDMLFFDDLVLHTEDLRLPHPLIPYRRFVLVPLAEIAPHLMHPVLHLTVGELLDACSDKASVLKL